MKTFLLSTPLIAASAFVMLATTSQSRAAQGGAFGIATVVSGSARFNFAAVDDVPNVISVYALPEDR
jgi:hypothetical protein